MYSLVGWVTAPLVRHGVGLGGSTTWLRGASSNARKRMRAYRQALADPHTSPTKLSKLRERCARPSHEILRHLAENKIGKAMTAADRRTLWFDLRFKRYSPLFLGQMKPQMRLWTAALRESQLPLPRLPEVAVAGRSNSGKSTLVNYLCGRHSAHVKRMPGSTTELVFWKVGRPAQLCLVDLPGYGFAMAPEERRLQWTEFTLWYVRSRRNLRRVLLLLDARHGLKPSDKEMIAFLERYGVPWQIVVTKCDKVVPKELARRLVILQQDTDDYQKMAGQPIPVSALKRKGMQTLREALDGLKVMKEVVKDGIKRRVYDLLELRRLRRAERARRRREAAGAAERQEEEGEGAASVAPAAGGATGGDAERGHNAGHGRRDDLHSILGDWGPEGAGADGAGDAASAAAPKPLVAELHYMLDDRDGRRIEGFMHNLFPELPDTWAKHSEGQVRGHTLVLPPARGGNGGDSPAHDVSISRAASWAEARYFSNAEADGFTGGSDSESDDETEVPMPRVQRFDPVPEHARGRVEVLSQPEDASSPFPAFGMIPQGEQSRRRGSDPRDAPLGFSGATTSKLRRSRVRPAPGQDHIYAEDDFASEDDVASGRRRFAPPAPTPESGGRILADARRRYEREWAMELESVEEVRASAGDAATSRPAAPRARSRGIQAAAAGGPAAPYIGKGGKPLLRGRGAWKLLGRPPAKILKKRQEADVAKVFGAGNKRRQRRNLGSGLTWEEAKEKWMNWYERNKRTHFDKVQMASSPKRDDVEAAFEERKMRLRRRGRGRGRQGGDEAAEPEMDG